MAGKAMTVDGTHGMLEGKIEKADRVFRENKDTVNQWCTIPTLLMVTYKVHFPMEGHH